MADRDDNPRGSGSSTTSETVTSEIESSSPVSSSDIGNSLPSSSDNVKVDEIVVSNESPKGGPTIGNNSDIARDFIDNIRGKGLSEEDKQRNRKFWKQVQTSGKDIGNGLTQVATGVVSGVKAYVAYKQHSTRGVITNGTEALSSIGSGLSKIGNAIVQIFKFDREDQEENENAE